MSTPLLAFGQEILSQMPKKPTPKWQMAVTPTTIIIGLAFCLNKALDKVEVLEGKNAAMLERIIKMEAKLAAIETKLDLNLRAYSDPRSLDRRKGVDLLER